MNWQEMWNDAEGKIWFKALVSFIAVTVLSTWAYVSIATEQFAAMGAAHVTLILGGMGITIAQNFIPEKKDNTNDKPTT